LARRREVLLVLTVVAGGVGLFLVLRGEGGAEPPEHPVAPVATKMPIAPVPARARRSVPQDDGLADRIRAFADELRARGVPTTLDELNGPPPPAAENAAAELTAALDALHAEFGREGDRTSRWPNVGSWGDSVTPIRDETPERVAELRAHLRLLRPFRARVAAALDRPRLRFAPQADSVVPQTVGTTTLRSLQRILSTIAVGSDEPADRLSAIEIQLRLAARDEPVTSAQPLVDLALAGGAIQAIRDGLEHGELDAAVARPRLDPLLAPYWPDACVRFARLQLAGALRISAWLADGGDIGDLPEGVRLDDDRAKLEPERLRVLADLTSIPTAPFTALLRAVQERGESPDGELHGSAYSVFLAARTAGQREAASRLARIALAAVAYRNEHGDFPASLDDLRPAFADGVPLDPFTDASFLYARTDTGVRLASRGTLADATEPPDEDTLRERCLLWNLPR
jgi:hypothetical protein